MAVGRKVLFGYAVIERYCVFVIDKKPHGIYISVYVTWRLFCTLTDTDNMWRVRNYSEITHDNNLHKCPSAASENLDIARYAYDFLLCS